MLRISLLAALTMAVAAPAAAQDAVDDLFANPREAEERTPTQPFSLFHTLARHRLSRQ